MHILKQLHEGMFMLCQNWLYLVSQH